MKATSSARVGAVLLAIVASVAAGCAGGMSPMAAMPSPVSPTVDGSLTVGAAPGSAAPLTAALASASATPAKPGDVEPSATPAAAEMIIYAGGVTMMEEPERIPLLIDRIIDLAESMGGRLQARRDDGVSIRVPSLHFRKTMSRIDLLGLVTHRSVAAEDVSEEFHDAEVRLENLRASRKRLQDFLAKAGDIAGMLTVEKELERVTQEIDRIEGRMRFLASRASFSTIDVQIAAAPKVTPAVVAETPAPVRRRGVVLPIPWLGRLDAGDLSTFE